MLIHCRVTPSIKFAGTHLCTLVESGTVRVKCLAQEYNTLSPARARTWTACSGVERTNHEATVYRVHLDGPITEEHIITSEGEAQGLCPEFHGIKIEFF